MPVTAEAIEAELATFDLDYEDRGVVATLLEYCMCYRLMEEAIVDEWFAFSTTRGNIALDSHNLELFEHEVLSKKVNKARSQAARKNARAVMKDADTLEELVQVEEEEESLLDSYTTPAKMVAQKRALTTPENVRPKRTASLGRSPHLLFSPASFSPSATPSQKYGSRTNRGEVVVSFGGVQGVDWRGAGGHGVSVRPLTSPEETLTHRYKYMFQKQLDIREVLTFRIESLGKALKDHYQIEEFRPVALPAQDTVTVLGQVGCDSNGKLNSKSVVLRGDREQVPVDLSELKEYSLFPGQVVALEGINSTGRCVVASSLHQGVPLPPHTPMSQSEPELETESAAPDQQLVLVACGPYTTSDSITYDPMMDLIDVINKSQPDVCILLGPFVDSKHEQVENCQLIKTFEEVFKHCMKGIIDGTRGSGAHLIFVPSLRDVHHDCVYPQPPFRCFQTAPEDEQRVHFVSDPCTLNVNGVVFGLTSTDVLFHMGAEEISSPPGGVDRFTRILKHILTQRSYYPLYPPAEEMNLDYEAFQMFAQLPATPDVLLVPSELRYFVKDVLGCVCVNPGRLTKGQVGGTFARLRVQRPRGPDAEQGGPCVTAQVVKI
uniref:DNA polymerase alpha subunit B n=1 Tax=Callorhinchus milii TaxID=7868 RepID=V9KK59_CALMI